MVIKGQFVWFSARLYTVNKHPWLENVEKNLADKGNPRQNLTHNGCTHTLLDFRQLTEPLMQPQRESVLYEGTQCSAGWEQFGDSELCSSVRGSSTKHPHVGTQLLAAAAAGTGLPSPWAQQQHRAPATGVGGVFLGFLWSCWMLPHL